MGVCFTRTADHVSIKAIRHAAVLHQRRIPIIDSPFFCSFFFYPFCSAVMHTFFFPFTCQLLCVRKAVRPNKAGFSGSISWQRQRWRGTMEKQRCANLSIAFTADGVRSLCRPQRGSYLWRPSDSLPPACLRRRWRLM